MFRLACWLLLIIAVAGCGFKKYQSTPEKNLLVRTTASGSLFTSVEAFLHVYDPPGADCKKKYLGGMNLKNGDMEVGLPTDRPVYLDVVLHVEGFTDNRFIHNSSIVTLHPAMRYVALVRYVDRIYSVSIRELASTGLPGRDIRSKPADCPL